MRQLVELAFQRAAPGGQPGRGLLRVLGQDGHRPGAGRQHRVVEAGDLLGAEQHERRLERDRRERAYRHRVAGAGRDDDDAAGELARGPPEGGLIDVAHPAVPTSVVRRRDPLGRATNDATTAAATLSVPPYRYHLPAGVLVMM